MPQKPKFEYLENKFIAKILIEKPNPFFVGELYPHVTSIAGNKIAPDIDILQRIPIYKLAVGYEVKWLHHFEEGISWYRFYRGVGQALSYFLHGVTHACLVLGWDNLPEEDISKILNYFEMFKTSLVMAEPFKKRASSTDKLTGAPSYRAEVYRCMGLIAFDKKEVHGMGFDPIQLRHEIFCTETIDKESLRNEIEIKRANLLAMKPNFKWDRKFIDRWK